MVRIKNEKEIKRYCEVPYGPVWFFGMIGGYILYIGLSIAFPISDATGLDAALPWLLSFMLCVMLTFWSWDGFINFLKFSDSGLIRKKTEISWEDLHISCFYRYKFGSRGEEYVWCFAFSDKFLSLAEAKEAKKKGLCMIIDKKRLDYILSKYQKEIHIPEEYQGKKKKPFLEIADRIEAHNYAIKSAQEKINQTD